MTTQDAREILARIVFELYAPGDPQWYPYEPETWLRRADAILSALSRAGLKVLGREPVGDMIDAMQRHVVANQSDMWSCNGHWQAAWDVAPNNRPLPKVPAPEMGGR